MTATIDRVYAVLDGRLDDFAEAVTRKIRVEASGYVGVPFEEHFHDAFVQIRAALDGIRSRAKASDLDLALARDVGRRRAMAGVSLADVIEAYHVAYREMWFELMRLASEQGSHTVAALASDAALLWNWSHRLISAMAAAHTDQRIALANETASLRRQLLDALLGGPDRVVEGATTARRLGLDPDAMFAVAVIAEIAERDVDELARSITGHGMLALGCHDGARGVIVAQGVDGEAFARAIERDWTSSPAGIGLNRHGLVGAQLSLQDAVDASLRAVATGIQVNFADDWLLCVLGSVAERLDPLLKNGRATAQSHPQWAETVVEFVAQGFSAVAASENLGVHPNSVRYRIERWEDATGWNPREISGIVASLIAANST